MQFLLRCLLTGLCFLFFNLARGQLITFSVKNESLERVFLLVEQQSSFRFMYSAEQLARSRPVTLSVSSESLKEVLNKIFADQPLGYTIDQSHILVKEKLVVKTDRAISGKVTNEAGLGLAGVTITVSATTLQTATNEAGDYSFTNVPLNAALEVTGAEIESLKVNTGALAVVNVIVRQKVGTLDEAYVIAYGKTTRRLATGTVSNVKKEEIGKQPVSNLLSIIPGRMTGIQVTPLSGTPGAQMTLRIRGQNSLANGNDPLIIVDGVPYPAGSINTTNGAGVPSTALAILNPSDIESISVLKDADATAIYGSRGANGVVLITTRQPRTGKLNLQFRTYAGLGKVSRKLDLLNTPQYLSMRYEAFRNDAFAPSLVSAPDLLRWDTTRYTDWQKELLGNDMHIYDAKLDLSGGNSLTQFQFGAGYHSESTILPDPDFGEQKLSTNLSVHQRTVDGRLRLSFNVSYARNVTNLPQSDITGQILLSPNAPALFTPGGDLNWEQSTWVNPLSLLRKTYRSENETMLNNLSLNWQIIPSLEAKMMLGYTMLRGITNTATPRSSFDPATSFSVSASFGNMSVNTLIWEPQLNYRRQFGHVNFQALAGATLQANRQRSLSQTGTGYASDDLLGSLTAASSISTSGESDIKYRYVGFFGRITTDWRGKYILSLNGRRDGSSRYGPANRFSNFGSAGLAWLFHKETLLSGLPWLSYGKLKTSAGITGNDQIMDYNYMDLYSTTSYPYQGVTPFQPTQLFNPYYTWEKVRKFEVGIDLGFLKDRILLGAALYYNRTDNQLVQYGLPPSTGFNSVLKNLPAKIENKGLELELTIVPIQSGDWKWTSLFNLTVPRNRLVSFDNFEQSTYANTYVIGQSLFISKRLQFLGVDQNTGLYTFFDYDRDGRITIPNDQKSIVYTGQQYYGGWQNNISWKKFSVSFLFQFTRQKFSSSYVSLFGKPGIVNNQPTLILDRWQQPGQVAPVQRFSYVETNANTAYTNYRSSDGAVSDGSFIRLRNLYLSYEFGKLFKHAPGPASIFIQGQNLFVITKYESLDPETRSLMPPLRVLTFGFHVNL